LTPFEELKEDEEDLKKRIAELQVEFDQLLFLKEGKKAFFDAVHNIWVGLIFVGIGAAIASLCWGHLVQAYPTLIPEALKKATWVEFACMFYLFRAISGSLLLKLPREENVRQD
jgi:hypothetical protein